MHRSLHTNTHAHTHTRTGQVNDTRTPPSPMLRRCECCVCVYTRYTRNRSISTREVKSARCKNPDALAHAYRISLPQWTESPVIHTVSSPGCVCLVSLVGGSVYYRDIYSHSSAHTSAERFGHIVYPAPHQSVPQANTHTHTHPHAY